MLRNIDVVNIFISKYVKSKRNVNLSVAHSM